MTADRRVPIIHSSLSDTTPSLDTSVAPYSRYLFSPLCLLLLGLSCARLPSLCFIQLPSLLFLLPQDALVLHVCNVLARALPSRIQNEALIMLALGEYPSPEVEERGSVVDGTGYCLREPRVSYNVSTLRFRLRRSSGPYIHVALGPL